MEAKEQLREKIELILKEETQHMGVFGDYEECIQQLMNLLSSQWIPAENVPEVGDIIEFRSRSQYKVTKVFEGNIVDLEELEVDVNTLFTNLKRNYFSIPIKDYRIVSPTTK